MIQPEYISLNNWAASLLIDYADYDLPLMYNEKKWDQWAIDLLNLPPFRGMNIPNPDEIEMDENGEEKNKNERWRKWARKVYYIMNNQ